MAFTATCNIETVSSDLRKMWIRCRKRGLKDTAAWAAELYFSLGIYNVPEDTDLIDIKELGKHSLAVSHFDLQEYDRAAYVTTDCQSPAARFLHYYSLYSSVEKKRLDDLAEVSPPFDRPKTNLNSLKSALRKARMSDTLDGYCLYLYGIVLKKLQLEKQALEILCEAIAAEPLHWDSWLELSTLVSDNEMLNDLTLPDCWMKDFFLAHTYLEIQMNDSALEIYSELSELGFSKSTYVKAQIAIAYHNKRELELAINEFQDIFKMDPFRLDNMDIYSNLLYVREMRVELSYLAHAAFEIDKYRAETCCIVGNYYSLRTQHEKAALYFQRALKLNPNYLSAWTLMGHEYMEMKNTSSAIQAYRQAIEVNRRDYRAWYGLGQTYEILKMPYYCLYYYKQAHRFSPYDSRMMVALGEAYEKLDKLNEAKRCFWKAHAVGDVEGMALIKLAKVCEKLNEEKHAATAYAEYIRDSEAKNATYRDELCHAYLFLAKYYFKHLMLGEAFSCSQQCLEYPETKEDAKTLLKQIAIYRANAEEAENCVSQMMSMQGISTPCGRLSPMNLTYTP